MGMIQIQFINRVLDMKDASLIYDNNLDESFFDTCEEEFKYIKEHTYTYGNVPDEMTFFAKFPNFEHIVVDEPNSYLIRELQNDKKRRYIASTVNELKRLFLEGKDEEAFNSFITAQDAVRNSVALNCVDILKDTSRYDMYIDKINSYDKYYIKTGFKELDDIIGGWDRHEELATIAARTNQGKSWILLKIASSAVEQGLNVGIYSGEMSANKVGYRIDTLMGGISNSGIIRGKSDIQVDYKKYLEGLSEKYPNGGLKVLTPNMIGGSATVSTLRAFIEKEKLDMLCVDQHSLLDDERHGRSSVEKASNISKDLKNLQVMMKIPIIAVSQQNRSSTENGVDSSHIAQSDRIAQDSTIILFFENKEKSEDNPGRILTINLAKSRDSVNMRKLSYDIDFDTGKFEYITESDDIEGCKKLAEEFGEEVPPDFGRGENIF